MFIGNAKLRGLSKKTQFLVGKRASIVSSADGSNRVLCPSQEIGLFSANAAKSSTHIPHTPHILYHESHRFTLNWIKRRETPCAAGRRERPSSHRSGTTACQRIIIQPADHQSVSLSRGDAKSSSCGPIAMSLWTNKRWTRKRVSRKFKHENLTLRIHSSTARLFPRLQPRHSQYLLCLRVPSSR